MAIQIRDIKTAIQTKIESREPKHNPVPATVVSVDGSIRHPYKPSYVWIKLFNQPEGITTAFNSGLTLQNGVHVWVEESPTPPYSWKIVGIYVGGVNEGSGSVTTIYQTSIHAQNHQYPSEQSPGLDPVKVYQPALQMLKTTGNNDLTISVFGNIYVEGFNRRFFPGEVVDLTSFLPDSGFIKRVLIYLDKPANAINIVEGGQVINNGIVPIPYPSIPQNSIPSSFVTLIGDMTSIQTASNVEDCRDFLGSGGGGGSASFEATQVGQVAYSIDGVSLSARTPIIDKGVWIADEGTLIVDG